jgi:hypothetical protein
MDPAIRLEELRALFLGAEASATARALAIAGAVALTAVVLHLVRRRALREEYTPIWLAVAAGLLAVSLSMDLLRLLTRLLGAWTPSSTIFFLGQVFLVAICLHFAVRLSQASLRLKNLGQEVALLRGRLEELARREGGSGA